MPRPPSQHPTDLELEILKTLWRLGPSPVRKVRDALAAGAPGCPPRDLAYTSVMTVMTIMTNKGYLRRTKNKARPDAPKSDASKSDGPKSDAPKPDTGYVYHATAARESTTGRMLRDLVDRAFAGSTGAAVLNLLNASDVTPDELRQLRELIERKEQQQPPRLPGRQPDPQVPPQEQQP